MSNFASGYIKYINHLEQINDAALLHPGKMITEVEGSYREHLQNIARNLVTHHTQTKLCMLSGPSSSGKTTTAHLLQQYLREMGKIAYIVSLDNYYLDRGRTPLLLDGTPDFETVHALDIGKIQDCLQSIFTEGSISVPNFNFAAGCPVGAPSVFQIAEGDLVIMEGIHALNPIFIQKLSPEHVMRIYVSVKQSIKDANGDVMLPIDLRLVRRIVRDIQFRSTAPEKTLSMWKNVVQGENSYIRPYRLGADYTVNSVHIYEPCVFRTIAIPLLRDIPEDSAHYRKARDLESRLMRFEPISTNQVPMDSMLREFIGMAR